MNEFLETCVYCGGKKETLSHVEEHRNKYVEQSLERHKRNPKQIITTAALEDLRKVFAGRAENYDRK